MKNYLIGALSILLIGSGCSKVNLYMDGESGETPALVTPEIVARIADPLNDNPFTGILEAYPCVNNSSTYYGNYVNGKLTVFNGYYTIVRGSVFGEYNREISVPAGEYNMIYWGTPKHDDPIDNSPAINVPGITNGVDMSELYFKLRANQDGTYMPTYDLVYALNSVKIGEEPLQASLTRVGVGMKVIVKQADNSIFDSSIADMSIKINGIAEKLNFYTAEPENMTKTVKFGLTRSADSTTMSNATVMMFPSAPSPLMELVVTFKDGSVHTLSQNLKDALAPNTMMTVNIVIGKIVAGDQTGDFSITNWNEENQTIDFPILN